MTVVQKPNHNSFVGNILPLIISSSYDVKIKIETGGQEILETVASPDLSNLVTVDLKSIVSEILSMELPDITADTTTHTEAVKYFKLKLYSGNVITPEVVEFRAFPGGVDGDIIESDFLFNNFLTNQSRIKEVVPESVEFLTYYPLQDMRFHIEAETKAGSKTKKIFIPSGQLVSINLSMSKLKEYFESDVLRFKVYITNSGETHTYTPEYHYLTTNRSEHNNQYLYVNSLGGVGTFRATGQLEENATISSEKVKADGLTSRSNVESNYKYIQNTIVEDSRTFNQIRELSSSFKVVALTPDMPEVFLQEFDNTFVHGEINDVQFSFESTKETIYSKIESEEQSVSDFVSYDAGEVFFKGSRVSDLTGLDLAASAYIPVENIAGQGAQVSLQAVINKAKTLAIASVTALMANYQTVEGGQVELANYYTKTEVDAKIANIDLSNYYTKLQADTKFALKSKEANWDLAYENMGKLQRFGHDDVSEGYFPHGCRHKDALWYGVSSNYMAYEGADGWYKLKSGDTDKLIGRDGADFWHKDNLNKSDIDFVARGISAYSDVGVFGVNKRVKIWDKVTNSTYGLTLGGWDGVSNRIESVGRKLSIQSYKDGIGFGIAGTEKLLLDTSGNLIGEGDVASKKIVTGVIGGHFAGLRLQHTNEINVNHSRIWINYRNADGTTNAYRNLFIGNGKNAHIVDFTGETKIASFYGDIRSNTYNSLVEGWGITNAGHGEFGSLRVRGQFITTELLAEKKRAINGGLRVCKASGKIKSVESITYPNGNNGIRIFTEEPILFEVGDYFVCQTYAGGNSNKYYKYQVGYVSSDKTHMDVYLGTAPFPVENTPAISDDIICDNGNYIDLVSQKHNQHIAWVKDGHNYMRGGRLEGYAGLGASDYGLAATDEDNNILFQLGNKRSIAGFKFEKDLLYTTKWNSGVGGIWIQSKNGGYQEFVAYKNNDDNVALYYESDNNWGIKGKNGGEYIFRLGSTNKISCATFTHNLMHIGSLDSGHISLTTNQNYPAINVVKNQQNYVRNWFKDDNNWGTFGIIDNKEYFVLGKRNGGNPHVANWTFSKNTFYHEDYGKYLILSNYRGTTDNPLNTKGRRGLTIYNNDSETPVGCIKIVRVGMITDRDTTQNWPTVPNYGFQLTRRVGNSTYKDIFRADKDGALISSFSFDEKRLSKKLGNIYATMGESKWFSDWVGFEVSKDAANRLSLFARTSQDRYKLSCVKDDKIQFEISESAASIFGAEFDHEKIFTEGWQIKKDGSAWFGKIASKRLVINADGTVSMPAANITGTITASQVVAANNKFVVDADGDVTAKSITLAESVKEGYTDVFFRANYGITNGIWVKQTVYSRYVNTTTMRLLSSDFNIHVYYRVYGESKVLNMLLPENAPEGKVVGIYVEPTTAYDSDGKYPIIRLKAEAGCFFRKELRAADVDYVQLKPNTYYKFVMRGMNWVCLEGEVIKKSCIVLSSYYPYTSPYQIPWHAGNVFLVSNYDKNYINIERPPYDGIELVVKYPNNQGWVRFWCDSPGNGDGINIDIGHRDSRVYVSYNGQWVMKSQVNF